MIKYSAIRKKIVIKLMWISAMMIYMMFNRKNEQMQGL